MRGVIHKWGGENMAGLYASAAQTVGVSFLKAGRKNTRNLPCFSIKHKDVTRTMLFINTAYFGILIARDYIKARDGTKGE